MSTAYLCPYPHYLAVPYGSGCDLAPTYLYKDKESRLRSSLGGSSSDGDSPWFSSNELSYFIVARKQRSWGPWICYALEYLRELGICNFRFGFFRKMVFISSDSLYPKVGGNRGGDF
ncbi:hypothetical protein Lal_00023600 [Lupinus albus]|nr:hypothetical protein Lal_00023600 [Lupinus albus]